MFPIEAIELPNDFRNSIVIDEWEISFEVIQWEIVCHTYVFQSHALSKLTLELTVNSKFIKM